MSEQGTYILPSVAEKKGDKLTRWVSMRPFPRGTALQYDTGKGDAGAAEKHREKTGIPKGVVLFPPHLPKERSGSA